MRSWRRKKAAKLLRLSSRRLNTKWCTSRKPFTRTRGPGSIVAKAKTITGASPLVEINLDWIDTSDHPGWSLNWVHHPDYLLDFLPDYLRQFCPVAEEMIEALQELGLENFPQDYPGDDEEELETSC